MRISFALLALIVVACSEGNTPRRPLGTEQQQGTCGDGVHGPGELCDGDELGSATCESEGFGPGELACAANRCDVFDLGGCGAPEECGDGVLQSPELCDGLELAEKSCESLGYTDGTLQCLENCGGFDLSLCGPWAGCGDGAIDGPEMCDGTELGGMTCVALGFESGTLSCRSDCMALDTTECVSACTPDCTGRECGPDPACGTSCGNCTTGTCNAFGRCEVTDPAGPVVVDLGANIGVMTPTKTLIISAVVTDPDGIDDVIGGLLKDPVTGSTYGAFQTAAAEGAYSLTLLWDAIHAVNPITTELDGTPRPFRAEFFDVAGHKNGQELEIILDCDESNEAVCANGSCMDVLSDADNCGACSARCPSPGPGERRCVSGECRPACDWSHHACGEECFEDSAVFACGPECIDCPPAGPNAHRVCVSEQCGQACDQDFHMCDDQCFPDDSVTHCGRDCISCFDPEHGDPACDRGTCEYTCDPGTLDCGGDCAPCPETAVTVTCEGTACVAASCAEEDLLCAGECSVCPEDTWDAACRYGECFPQYCSGLQVVVLGECVGFVPERIHIDGFSAGYYSDLVLDANDAPNIAYTVVSSDSPSRVELRTLENGGWQVETVAETNHLPGRYIRMVLAADGTPHIAYIQFDPALDDPVFGLIYATRGPAGWSTEVIDGNVELDAIGLVLDIDGNPVISFETNHSVAVTRRTTTGWETLGALSSGDKENIALATDAEGVLHVAYEAWEPAWYRIKAAEWNGDSWDTETAANYELASNIAFLFDRAGEGHLVFRIVREGYNRIHHVRTGATGFEPGTDTVVSVDGLDSTNHLRMAEGSDDSLHVAFIDEVHERLDMYQGWDDILPDEMDWRPQWVTYDEPAVVSPPAIAIDSQDRIHLTYHDADANDLIYSITEP